MAIVPCCFLSNLCRFCALEFGTEGKGAQLKWVYIFTSIVVVCGDLPDFAFFPGCSKIGRNKSFIRKLSTYKMNLLKETKFQSQEAREISHVLKQRLSLLVVVGLFLKAKVLAWAMQYVK